MHKMSSKKQIAVSSAFPNGKEVSSGKIANQNCHQILTQCLPIFESKYLSPKLLRMSNSCFLTWHQFNWCYLNWKFVLCTLEMYTFKVESPSKSSLRIAIRCKPSLSFCLINRVDHKSNYDIDSAFSLFSFLYLWCSDRPLRSKFRCV